MEVAEGLPEAVKQIKLEHQADQVAEARQTVRVEAEPQAKEKTEDFVQAVGLLMVTILEVAVVVLVLRDQMQQLMEQVVQEAMDLNLPLLDHL